MVVWVAALPLTSSCAEAVRLGKLDESAKLDIGVGNLDGVRHVS